MKPVDYCRLLAWTVLVVLAIFAGKGCPAQSAPAPLKKNCRHDSPVATLGLSYYGGVWEVTMWRSGRWRAVRKDSVYVGHWSPGGVPGEIKVRERLIDSPSEWFLEYSAMPAGPHSVYYWERTEDVK